ncbi:MAG: HAMP domain-containing sensor histidine kinase [Holophagae bacterium]
MRRQGPITSRHLVVAVLVVVVINAQLTWWIVFVLRLNRENLDLERDRLLTAARTQAQRAATELETAQTALEAALVMGDVPGREAVPKPFVGWREVPAGGDCPTVSMAGSGFVELAVVSGPWCVTGVLAGDWRAKVLDVGDALEVIESGDSVRAGVPLPEPFSGLTVQPRDDVWEQALDQYRRRIIMMTSEGAFFAVLLLVLIGLLWRTFRRELELERQHRNFLSAITHELKSPLAAMRLALETVTAGRATGADAKRFLDNAIDDAEQLEDLVEKVLETTRFTESEADITLVDSSLSSLVHESVDQFSRRVLASGARIEASLTPDVYAEIDAEAMAIVLSNLLENAVKYGGDPPVVEVDLNFDGAHAVIEVGDNGNGVAEEDRRRIFDRFYRSGDEMTRTTGGTGLGLFLVQQIVKMHRGRVEVAATGPDGTVFRVTLPAHEE